MAGVHVLPSIPFVKLFNSRLVAVKVPREQGVAPIWYSERMAIVGNTAHKVSTPPFPPGEGLQSREANHVSKWSPTRRNGRESGDRGCRCPGQHSQRDLHLSAKPVAVAVVVAAVGRQRPHRVDDPPRHPPNGAGPQHGGAAAAGARGRLARRDYVQGAAVPRRTSGGGP